ncbi:13815_t:CDS:1 [Acaulospora colombiana]|uniref:13815_t:CDS:1 n=1 Tax=Acaulospora colombiana TaxID=27376 RepID=A0ACA9MKP2_9GLOM|nr:13815_t:CDS:1 [Acaulospora colombiana]
MSSNIADSSETVLTLLIKVRDNFKYLADCYRGNDDPLLSDEIDNLQIQTELRITQIENKYNYEIGHLREGIIEENEILLFIQQQTINEQVDIIRNQQDFSNELAEKNQTLQDQLDLYRTENYRLTESIISIQGELLETQQNFEDQSIYYVEVSEIL